MSSGLEDITTRAYSPMSEFEVKDNDDKNAELNTGMPSIPSNCNHHTTSIHIFATTTRRRGIKRNYSKKCPRECSHTEEKTKRKTKSLDRPHSTSASAFPSSCLGKTSTSRSYRLHSLTANEISACCGSS